MKFILHRPGRFFAPLEFEADGMYSDRGHVILSEKTTYGLPSYQPKVIVKLAPGDYVVRVKE